MARVYLREGSCVCLATCYRNHVWSYDFVVDSLANGKLIRILTVIDEFVRECLVIRVDFRPRMQEVDIPLGIAADDDATSEEATVALGMKSGESLPDSWTLGRTTHTVNISDADVPIARTAFFEADSAEIAEDGSSVEVVLRISTPPSSRVSIPVTVEGDSNTAEVGAQGASFAGMVNFAAYDDDVSLFLDSEDDDNAVSGVVVFAIGNLPEN